MRDDGPGVEVGERNPGRSSLRRVPHGVPEVVVDAEKVHGARDGLEVPVAHRRSLDTPFAVVGDGVLRVSAAEDRVQVQPVGLAIHPAGRLTVGLAVPGGARRVQVEGDANPGVAVRGAQPIQDKTVAEQEVVGGGERLCRVGLSRRVYAVGVAEPGCYPGLVQRDPRFDPIRQGFVDEAGVLGEALARLAVRPATAVFQGLRQIPVVEREHRLDAAVPQAVHEPAVEVEAFLVGRAGALGLHPGQAVRTASCTVEAGSAVKP